MAAIAPPVRDRLILPLMVLAAAAMVALAMIWPQGAGRPSPAPFDHPLPAAKR